MNHIKVPADLRKYAGVPGGAGHLRKYAADPPVTEETIDDRLTQLRRAHEEVTAGYLKLLDRPGLTVAEVRTIHDRYISQRGIFDASAKTSRRRAPLHSKTERRA